MTIWLHSTPPPPGCTPASGAIALRKEGDRAVFSWQGQEHHTPLRTLVIIEHESDRTQWEAIGCLVVRLPGQCPKCGAYRAQKFGRSRHGSRREKCGACGHAWSLK